MSAPLWSFWSNLKKNRWWTFPQKCLRDSTEIFVSYQQPSYRKYMGGSILCSTSERSNQQTNSQVSEALHHLTSPTSESTWFSFPHTGRFGFWNMLTWLIASGRTRRSLNLKQQLWADWGEKPQATHVCCTQVGQVAPKTSRSLASPSVCHQQCRRCQLDLCIHFWVPKVKLDIPQLKLIWGKHAQESPCGPSEQTGVLILKRRNWERQEKNIQAYRRLHPRGRELLCSHSGWAGKEIMDRKGKSTGC